MKDKLKLLICGGDMRQLYCAKRLSDKFDTAISGFDEEYIPSELSLRKADITEKGEYDCIILPVIPFLEDGSLNAPCTQEKIKARDIAALVKTDAPVFAGNVTTDLSPYFGDSPVFDYMKREELCLLNAIPTAEGAVQIAMEELPVTLSGLKVLITGCGRIGMALIEILKGFGADVTVAVRNSQGTAKARILGVKSCCTRDIDTDFGLVFNTVPSMIFSRDLLKKFDKGTLFIDLASKPGGIDFESAAELGIKAIWALGLPGKTAPITSGEIIADTVSGMLSERGEGSE